VGRFSHPHPVSVRLASFGRGFGWCVGIHLLQIYNDGLGPELPEELVVARVAREPVDAAVRVLPIAEDERIRWARLRAGRLDVAVAEGLAASPLVALRPVDPVNAERTLLDQTLRAHGHVGVEL